MFGDRLRRLRLEHNLSQEELASRVGVHLNTVSKWENGVIPNMKSVLELAKVLGTTSAYLLGEDVPVQQRENVNNDGEALPVVNIANRVKDPSFVKEGNLVGNENVLVYESNGDRFILPATRENQAWFREFMMNAVSGRALANA